MRRALRSASASGSFPIGTSNPMQLDRRSPPHRSHQSGISASIFWMPISAVLPIKGKAYLCSFCGPSRRLDPPIASDHCGRSPVLDADGCFPQPLQLLGRWASLWGRRAFGLFGSGVRIESDVAASVLYTRYTTVSHSEISDSFQYDSLAAEFTNYGCVRSVTEIRLGVGWGTYIYDKKAAVDLLASYDFSIFWNQNMMRRLVDLNTLQENASPSNLYLHGVTADLRFTY